MSEDFLFDLWAALDAARDSRLPNGDPALPLDVFTTITHMRDRVAELYMLACVLNHR